MEEFFCECDSCPIVPYKLKKGDTISIIATGYALSQSHIDNINNNAQRLREMGFKVIYGRHLFGYEDPPFASSIKNRLSDLNDALRNKDVKMILTARGGYGTMELLPCVDWDAFKCDPKIVIGYSDVTALLLPLNKFTNIVTYQGPMAGEIWTERTWEHFEDLFVKENNVRKIRYENDGIITLNPGKSEGFLYGAHFDTMMALFSTKYELCPKEPYIILVEEIDTSLREIDRMMQTLSLNGILKNASGFVYAKSKTVLFTEEELIQILNKHLSKFPYVPAFYGLHFGHFVDNGEHMFIPNGKYGTINADEGRICFNLNKC